MGPTIYCDTQSPIHLSKRLMLHSTSKDVDVKLHFIRSIISQALIKLDKVYTEDIPYDILTKRVALMKFKHFLDLVRAFHY